MKALYGIVVLAALFASTIQDSSHIHFLRFEGDLSPGRIVVADQKEGAFSNLVCKNPKAAAALKIRCPTPSPSPATVPPLTSTADYRIHMLAIGDWGVTLNGDSCCNKYRQTGVDNPAYYKDRQAQDNVGYLLSLSAKNLSPKPQAILSHGDNFYYNGIGSANVQNRFQSTFEEPYMFESLKNIPWYNVMGNHDYGGSVFICGKDDASFHECPSIKQMLIELEERFTRQQKYKSPFGDRWKMDDHYYKKTLKDDVTGITVDIFNVDTNFASTHGGQQICCQCYGYRRIWGGKYNGELINCNEVPRGHKYCANGNTALFDACMAKLKSWQDDSLRQLIRDTKASKATWKIVNSHYSPHHHMEPNMMKQWLGALDGGNVHVFINGHTHAEGHDYANFKSHLITNGAGGGIQSQAMGGPPPYATNISQIWTGADAPYGFFELSFARTQMRVRFVTFDGKWQFNKRLSDTVKGGTEIQHCWLIPLDGSRGKAC